MAISLYLGPYQPFLEEELASRVRSFRSVEPLSPLVLLVPNRALVRHLREDLARKNGSVVNLRVLTLHQYLIEFTEEKWIQEGFRLLPESIVPWVLRENAKELRPKGGGPFAAVEKTPGFPKTLRATLSELRQGGFDPQALKVSAQAIGKARDRKRLSQKLEEFAGLLTKNRAWKAKNHWKDREDLYEDALTLAPPQAAIWTYGFYDASALQQKVLMHFCSPPRRQDAKNPETGKEGHWFIPYEDHPAFDYAKPFVEWAKGLGKVQKSESFKSGKTTALGRLQDHLFETEIATSQSSAYSAEAPRNDGHLKFEDSDVKILLCPGEPREMREVVRAITGEAERRRTHLSQCGLLLRQLETYRRMIAPAFEGQGVAVAKKPSVYLMETPEAKAFLLLLECFQSEFPRETLMDLLASPNLSHDGFGVGEEDWNPHLWDQVSKEAGVVEGEASWIDRMKEAEKPRSGKGSFEEEGPASGEVTSLVAFRMKVLQTLFDAKKAFERTKDWAGKTGVLFELAEKVFRKSDAKDELKTLRRGVEILSQGSFKVAPDELKDFLTGLMEEVRIPWKAPEAGGVEVSELMQARGVPFDVLVLPGLVEQGFPRVPRPDPLLLDEERRILNERHLGQARIPEKAEGRLEEKMLFLLAVRSARQGVILTASHLHPGSGAPRVPSSYLHEALRAVTGGRQAKWEDSPYVRKVAVSDWVRDGGEERVDDLEEVLSRFQEAREGNPLPAQAYAGQKPFFDEARRLLKERQGSRKFTIYDGVFGDPQAVEALRQTHSLKDKTLSASRLETYAACPLRYFYRYVLGLKVHPEPERVFQLDPAEKGNLMHSILEETLSRGKQEGWLKDRDGEKAARTLEEETQKAFKSFEKEGVTGSQALWQWSQFSLRRDLQRTLRKVLADQEWTPVDFEKAFGREGQPEVTFETPGETFRLEGFMDRVDLSADGKALRVVDYKSGSKEGFKKDSVKEGTKIQMPLYLWACRTLYPGVTPKEAVYEFLTAKGDYGSVGFNASDWKTVEEPLKALLTTAAEAVEQGLFPAAAKACDRCDYRTLCGPGVEKREERKRDDVKVERYFELKELK
ncbi:MAG TPA: PD-(D/E)XK nuclease family protein [bacterium]|nr:PD-(D/E)XK nuclease family protein [bacterium]